MITTTNLWMRDLWFHKWKGRRFSRIWVFKGTRTVACSIIRSTSFTRVLQSTKGTPSQKCILIIPKRPRLLINTWVYLPSIEAPVLSNWNSTQYSTNRPNKNTLLIIILNFFMKLGRFRRKISSSMTENIAWKSSKTTRTVWIRWNIWRKWTSTKS